VIACRSKFDQINVIIPSAILISNFHQLKIDIFDLVEILLKMAHFNFGSVPVARAILKLWLLGDSKYNYSQVGWVTLLPTKPRNGGQATWLSHSAN
jgi:hypothetical protein